MGKQVEKQAPLLTDYDANSEYSAAYQTVYANICFDWDREQARQYAILLASPAYYPGQATVAANVAIAAAQSGTPVALIDADLRMGGLQQRFGIEDAAGLSDLLKGEALEEEVSQLLRETFVPGLRLLSTGRASFGPPEISRLMAAKLPDILARVRRYVAERESRPSMIVFNSPPVQAGVDAAQISALVERTFLIIAAGHTTRTQAKRAQEQLQRAHAKLAGIIMLDV